MVTNKQLESFKETGYFVLENFFTESEMQQTVKQIDICVAEHESALKGKGTGEGVNRSGEITFTTHLVKRNVYFQQFCSQVKLVDAMLPLLGPDIAMYWDQAVYKRPETHKDFPWHQDNGYGMVMSEEYVTCWIALEEATIENGCIWVMPRSHKNGIVEHQKTPIGWQCYFGDDPGVPVPLKKGSMVVFSSLLFHRSGPNISHTIRKGYIVQYSPVNVLNAKTGQPFKKMVVARDGKPDLDTQFLEL